MIMEKGKNQEKGGSVGSGTVVLDTRIKHATSVEEKAKAKITCLQDKIKLNRIKDQVIQKCRNHFAVEPANPAPDPIGPIAAGKIKKK